ncbi:ArsR/SmtB family transcription factor [Priestia megaterium]|uniref:ArsR/SmtB family transcription factor n=1 Tax=Priestia megaterium TaxID=1404 RepID=UPI003D07CFFC
MEQKFFMLIENYEQLKTVSDPFRTKLLTLLIEQSYTGQQLAKSLEVPRSKIHYSLNELEKNGFIEVVKKEEKGSIVQKFYKATARSFIPSEKLLPHSAEIADYFRESALNVLSRARNRVLSAPEEAFQLKEGQQQDLPQIAMQIETKANEEEFIKWLKKYRELVEEFKNMNDDKGKFYYLTTVGFETDEPYFEDNHIKEDTN